MTHAIDRGKQALTVLAASWLVGSAAWAQPDEERALEAVRQEIKAVEQRVARQTMQRAAELAVLREAELKVAAAAAELARIRERLREQRAERAELAAESKQAAERLDGERATLARQVRLSYMTGREELFKLLLSQETPATLGRMLVYYDYFNRARSVRISAVGAELAHLATLAVDSRRVEEELERLLAAQAREIEAQEAWRAERRRALERLETSIEAGGGEIETLKGEEERLTALVIELGELMAGFPEDAELPFASLKGRLAWPVEGGQSRRYGQLRDGGPLRWNGVLLAADAGTPVRAVYRGRVAFSDWLPGLGLLIIVDHGDGYMSLYGHNEALLRESGEWVAPGDSIAQVGDSGGQAQTGLYFEIRHNGEPVDPGQWIPAGPARR
jgi:septal ring factor EnvC (AmiA/AmiB activator)